MNSLQLYNCPYVVQKKVLDSMDFKSIFLLSLCSKKVNDLIVAVEKSRFKSIKYIHYHILSQSVTINAFILDGSSQLIIDLNPIADVECSGTLTISGTCVRYGYTSILRSKSFVLLYRRSFQNKSYYVRTDRLLESIQDHSEKLFGNEKEYRLSLGVSSIDYILPRLRSVTSGCVWVYPVIEGKTVDDFCSASPFMEYLRIGEKVISRLEENSKLYGIKTLDIKEDNSMIIPDILHKFTGRQAFMCTSKIGNSDMIQFLNRWKSNEAFQNVEILSIVLQNVTDPIEPIEIKNSVGVKVLKTGDDAPEYHFKRRISSKSDVLSSGKFITFNYLVRDYDNRVASILIEEKIFIFGVWDLTENEFLEKFSKNK